MPADCRIDAGGALIFDSTPLADAMTILGQLIKLKLTADKPQGFVSALLIDAAPDGAQTLISRGFANLMHRHSIPTRSPSR